MGAAASDDDDSGGDQDDEAAGEADVEQAAAVAAASPPPPTTRGGKRNLTATIPDLLGSRSLGLDWGHKKIGIGLSAGFSQRPLGTIPNAGGVSGNATLNRPTLDHILSLVKAEGAVRIVIGNPLFRYVMCVGVIVCVCACRPSHRAGGGKVVRLISATTPRPNNHTTVTGR